MSKKGRLRNFAEKKINEAKAPPGREVYLTEHPKMFEEILPSFTERLKKNDLSVLAQNYAKCDSKAIKAQKKYKRTVKLANLAAFVTAASGALLLIFAGLHKLEETLGTAVVWVTSSAGALSAIVAGGLFYFVKEGEHNADWVQMRTRAEKCRIDYFKDVIKAMSKNIVKRLIAMEYVRRFFLDNQITFFEERGEEHKESADNLLKKSLAVMIVASFATWMVGPLHRYAEVISVIAGLGVITNACGTWLRSASSVSLDKANAKRYSDAAWQLQIRKRLYEEYRDRIFSGDPDAVKEYYEPIFKVLESDLQAFRNDERTREQKLDEMMKTHESNAKKITFPQGKKE